MLYGRPCLICMEGFIGNSVGFLGFSPFLFSWGGRKKQKKQRIVSNREDKTVQIKSILWPV